MNDPFEPSVLSYKYRKLWKNRLIPDIAICTYAFVYTWNRVRAVVPNVVIQKHHVRIHPAQQMREVPFIFLYEKCLQLPLASAHPTNPYLSFGIATIVSPFVCSKMSSNLTCSLGVIVPSTLDSVVLILILLLSGPSKVKSG